MSLPCLQISIDSPSPTRHKLRFLIVVDKCLHLTTGPHLNPGPQTSTQATCQHTVSYKTTCYSWKKSCFPTPLYFWTCFSSALIPVPFLSLDSHLKHDHLCHACPHSHQQSQPPLPEIMNYSLFFNSSPFRILIQCLLNFLIYPSSH